MSDLIIILGESGTGKSSSLKNLSSEETYIINVLNKPLPFRGYKKKYCVDKKNYSETDDYQKILAYLKSINERAPHIKNVIIDDFSFLMNNEFMRRCREKSFDKFTDMGANMYSIMQACMMFRDDLTCFLMCHTEKDHAGLIKPKTVGKMTSDYVGISERVTIVLHTQIIDRQYKFLTQHDGTHVAKSPDGMFDSLYIDNDLQYVKEQMHDYFNEEES
jgi:hypothetical protein